MCECKKGQRHEVWMNMKMRMNNYEVLNLTRLLMQNSHSILRSSFEHFFEHKLTPSPNTADHITKYELHSIHWSLKLLMQVQDGLECKNKTLHWLLNWAGLTYVRVSYVRGSDVRGLMLGVLMLGVQPRMSENGRSGFSNIGGSYVRGWTPNVRLWKPRTSDFEHWNFRTFGVQPRTSEFEGSSFSDIRGSTPNVRIWRIEN